MEEKKEMWKTKDLWVTATLVTFKFQIDSVDRSNPAKMMFSFPKTPELIETVDKFWDGKLLIEPLALFNTYRLLKNRMRSS